MLVFEQEVTQGLNPERYYVESTGQKALPVDQLIETASSALPEGVTITGVTIPSDPGRAYQMSLSKPRRASIAVNQYTGEVLGRNERGAFFMFMFRMHRWLLDSMPSGDGPFVGKLVVGVSTFVFVAVLLTGVVIWWPKTKRALRNRLRISLGKGWWRFWYDLHVAGGMYALLFLLAMALTGLTWSFPWYRAAFYKVFGVETMPASPHAAQAPSPSSDKKPGDKEKGAPRKATFLHWQAVYERLAAEHPDYKQVTLSGNSASLSFDRWGNQRAADRYTFDPKSGEILERQPYREAAATGKIRGWIYSVHVGSFGGMTTRVLAFVAALLGAALPVTGYYLLIKRLLRRSKQASR